MKPVSLRALALAAALAAPLAALPVHAAELSVQGRQSLIATVDGNQAALDHAALEIWKFTELG